MYFNKTELVNLVFNKLSEIEIPLDDTKNTSIKNVLNTSQLIEIVRQVVNCLPKTDQEHVLEFHKAFKVEKEETEVIENFKFSRLRFNLILEEALELAFALGLDKATIYEDFIKHYTKLQEKNPEVSIVEVIDAYNDLLYVTYGGIDVMNLNPVQNKCMVEIQDSNMSKLIPKENNWVEVVKATSEYYRNLGIEIYSKDLKNGYIGIFNKDTDKILKPTTYKSPNLKKHFK